MDSLLPILITLIPLILGFLGNAFRISHSVFRFLALTCIGLEVGNVWHMSSTFVTTPIVIPLSAAIIFSTLCVVLGQQATKFSSSVLSSNLIMLGLSLSALLAPAPINRYFLIGVLGYAAYSLHRSNRPSTIKTICLAQMALATVFLLASSLVAESLSPLAGLFLAVTLVPLAPFHLPFAYLIRSAQDTLSGLWVVVFLTLGFAELHDLHPMIPTQWHSTISWFALGSAFYASLKCLGQRHVRFLVTYATVAHTALLWGLTTVFPTFAQWGFQFGITLAFVMNGLLMAYTFVEQRYGSHPMGTLPGLASSMPRLGIGLVLLITLAVLLPVIPTFSGLSNLPSMESQDTSLIVPSLTVFGVWVLGSWYFLHLLHHTAFGNARQNIPYSDLQNTEMFTLALMVFGASYIGLFY